MRRLQDETLQEIAKDMMGRRDITDHLRARWLRKLDEVDRRLTDTDTDTATPRKKKE